MTQPPDDRPRPPDQPEGQSSPEDPTVPWTPPDSDQPAEQGGAGSGENPDATATPEDTAAGEPTAPAEPTAPLEPTPPVPPPAAAAGPIISASPTAPASPGADAPEAGAVPPGGGWQVPAAAAAAPDQDGYVIAGVGARFVAWLIDILLAGIIPAALSLVLVDWSAIITQAIDQARLDPRGQLGSFTYQIPVTLDYVLVVLIGVGIQYLYFVGFWTSGLRATPGMIGLKVRVVDVASGGTLSIVQATKRWTALGFPLALLVLIPVLQNTASLIQSAVVIILFFTVVLDDRKQGAHDKFANSLVIRSVTSGNGATAIGCLVWWILVILLGIIASAVFLSAALPALQEFIREMPQNTV